MDEILKAWSNLSAIGAESATVILSKEKFDLYVKKYGSHGRILRDEMLQISGITFIKKK